MYYYIVDYNQSAPFQNMQKKIKQYLTDLNISGEMSLCSPARSAEELAQMALERGFNSIVGIGGDELINRLANVVATSPAALGVIPYGLSDAIADIFGVKNVKSACHSLKQRKITSIGLGHILPNKYFLSPLEILTEKPMDYHLEIDGKYMLDARSEYIVITPNLRLDLYSEMPVVSKSFWRSSKPSSVDKTSIGAVRLSIQSVSPISVLSAGFEIAKTPLDLTFTKEVLKIITNRAKIN